MSDHIVVAISLAWREAELTASCSPPPGRCVSPPSHSPHHTQHRSQSEADTRDTGTRGNVTNQLGFVSYLEPCAKALRSVAYRMIVFVDKGCNL